MADMNKPTIQKTRNSLRVKVDVARNRLYIFIAGEITKKSLDQFFTEVRFGIADLKPEYNIITDLTQCHIGHLSAIPTFRKIMHYVSSHGVKDIIRVVNSKISFTGKPSTWPLKFRVIHRCMCPPWMKLKNCWTVK